MALVSQPAGGWWGSYLQNTGLVEKRWDSRLQQSMGKGTSEETSVTRNPQQGYPTEPGEAGASSRVEFQLRVEDAGRCRDEDQGCTAPGTGWGCAEQTVACPLATAAGGAGVFLPKMPSDHQQNACEIKHKATRNGHANVCACTCVCTCLKTLNKHTVTAIMTRMRICDGWGEA